MYRDYRLYLEDILEAIRKIKEYTAKTDFNTFSKDTKTQDAVVRNLEIIGEASGRLPEMVRQSPRELNGEKLLEYVTSLRTNISVSVFRSSGMLYRINWMNWMMLVYSLFQNLTITKLKSNQITI